MAHAGRAQRTHHPQLAGRVAVVHNGIIENFAELKAELKSPQDARVSTSDTDTEVDRPG